MLKVRYEVQAVEFSDKIIAIKALRECRPVLSLKEDKELFESGVLFVKGVEWDRMESAFRKFAHVELAERDEEKLTIDSDIRKLRAERENLYFREREIERHINELERKQASLPWKT